MRDMQANTDFFHTINRSYTFCMGKTAMLKVQGKKGKPNKVTF